MPEGGGGADAFVVIVLLGLPVAAADGVGFLIDPIPDDPLYPHHVTFGCPA